MVESKGEIGYRATVHVKVYPYPGCVICAEKVSPPSEICQGCGLPIPGVKDYGIVSDSDVKDAGFMKRLLERMRNG